MVLTFRSTTPESYTLVRVDSEGNRSVATTTKTENRGQWLTTLRHPSGQSWSRHCYGPNALDHVCGMLEAHESDYRDAAARGHRPPQPKYDNSVRIDDAGNYTGAQIMIDRRRDSRPMR